MPPSYSLSVCRRQGMYRPKACSPAIFRQHNLATILSFSNIKWGQPNAFLRKTLVRLVPINICPPTCKMWWVSSSVKRNVQRILQRHKLTHKLSKPELLVVADKLLWTLKLHVTWPLKRVTSKLKVYKMLIRKHRHSLMPIKRVSYRLPDKTNKQV